MLPGNVNRRGGRLVPRVDGAVPRDVAAIVAVEEADVTSNSFFVDAFRIISSTRPLSSFEVASSKFE